MATPWIWSSPSQYIHMTENVKIASLGKKSLFGCGKCKGSSGIQRHFKILIALGQL